MAAALHNSKREEKAEESSSDDEPEKVEYMYLPVLVSSVTDPNPDPPDPHVFGPPGSRSTSQRYGSGSGSFCHKAKIVRKTLIPTVL